jgi:dCTP diphosphatase
MRQFSEERDWLQFHDPKSLILALVGEVGELAELFQWVPSDKAKQRASKMPLQARAAEEISDVLLYLVRLADELDINLVEAANRKLDDSQKRFSIEQFRSKAPGSSVLDDEVE